MLGFFKLTCDYGKSPWLPIWILFWTWVIMSLIYYVLALGDCGRDSGIWKESTSTDPEKLTKNTLGDFKALRVALYFSLLSAFTIGWRKRDIGLWIARMQFTEYQLKGRGWVRSLSGVQALLSVCMLVLWVLTYFGHPFDY
jgi:hypothetical protein